MQPLDLLKTRLQQGDASLVLSEGNKVASSRCAMIEEDRHLTILKKLPAAEAGHSHWQSWCSGLTASLDYGAAPPLPSQGRAIHSDTPLVILTC